MAGDAMVYAVVVVAVVVFFAVMAARGIARAHAEEAPIRAAQRQQAAIARDAQRWQALEKADEKAREDAELTRFEELYAAAAAGDPVARATPLEAGGGVTFGRFVDLEREPDDDAYDDDDDSDDSDDEDLDEDWDDEDSAIAGVVDYPEEATAPAAAPASVPAAPAAPAASSTSGGADLWGS